MENVYVDEYIRTEKGISKIIDIESVEDFGEILFKTDKKDEEFICQSNIKEHSFDILDLIEIGDLVNGKLIVGKEFTEGYPQYIDCIDNDFFINEFYGNDIKSIVTHEQLATAEYKIEEN